MNVFELIEKHGIELHGDIEYFAELIRQDEREACAKVVEMESYRFATEGAAMRCAETIRARGEA